MSDLQQHTLPNGLTVVHEAMPWLSSVSFTLLLPVGAATDPDGFSGSATVLNDWLYRGAGENSSQALSDRLDGLGLRRGGGSGKEYMTLSGSLLAESFGEALKLHADILRRARLPDAEFASARSLALQELDSLQDNPTQQLFETLAERYFASAHGRSSYGDNSGLERLEAETLREDYARRVAPRGAILATAGGVPWETVQDAAEKLFGDWRGEGVALPEVRVAPTHQEHVQQDTAQVQIGVAYGAVPPGGPGWYENALAVAVLSGGMGARLFSEVREKRGLAYSVAAVSRSLRGFGYTLGYAGTTPERADETLGVLLHELRRLAQGVSEEELERAKTGLLSQLVMQGESSASRSAALARDAFLLGRPRTLGEIQAELSALGSSEVNRFLAERYNPRFTVLTLGSKPLLEAALA